MIIHGHIRKSKVKRLTKVQQSEYDAWCKSVGIVPGAKKQKTFTSVKMPKLVVPAERSTRHIPSLNPTDMRPATRPIDGNMKKYTGDKMIGIGTLHKSNAVPIFNSEHVEDIAKMRR